MIIAVFRKSRNLLIRSKKTTIITLMLILIIQLVFNLLLVNNFFPITEGWYQDYARYILEGKVIYRDFYCAVPPGYIWWMTLLCKLFNNSFLLLRLYGIVERLILISVLFFLLKKVYSNKIIFFALTISSIFYASTNADVFYGYYQSSLLFAVISLVFCIKMYEKFEKNRITDSILFGFFAGIAFLMKQNTGAILPTFIGCVYILLTYKKNLKKALHNIIVSFLTALSVLGVAAIYLAVNGALVPFFQQVFGGVSSKGSLTSIFFSFVPRMVNSQSAKIVILVLVTFLLNYIYKRYAKSGKKNYFFRIPIIILLISWYYLLYCYLIGPFHVAESFLLLGLRGKIIFIILGISSICFFLLVMNKTEGAPFNWIDISYYFSFALYFLFMFYYVHKYQITSTDWNIIREYRQYIVYSIFFVTFLLIILIICKNHTKWDKKIGTKLLLTTASFMLMYIHGMSYIVEEHGTLLSLSILIGELLSTKSIYNYFKNGAIVLFGLFMSTTVFIQRNNLPYHWWGVNDMPNSYSANTTYLDKNLKGIKGEKSYTSKLNQIYKLVEDNKMAGDTLYTFPHINYFNVMADLDSPAFAKVHYFDVCNDKTASKDAKILKNNLPTFIIWQDFTESEWLTHESIFRNGQRSGQRDLQKFYKEITQDGTYTLLANVKLNNSDPIYVWGLNDGRNWTNYHLGDTISFSGESYNADSFIKKGLSVNEGKYTWTEGNALKLTLHLESINSDMPITAKFDLGAVFHDEQKVEIYQDGAQIYSQIIRTGDNLKFKIKNIPKSGDITLKFEFPDAASLSSLKIADDDRKLALAIKSAVFTQNSN